MAEVPELHAAQLAAAYYGERQGGDLHDFVRVTPNRVLFGLLDMAGRLEENSAIVSAAQQTFRALSRSDGDVLHDRPRRRRGTKGILCLARLPSTDLGGVANQSRASGYRHHDRGRLVR